MRIISTILALLFGYAGVLQANDPDRVRWIAMYGIAAAVLLTTAWYRRLVVPPLVVGVVAAIWAATLVPTVLREAAFTWNEAERELGGLVVIAAGTIGAAIWSARSNRRSRID